MADILHPNDIGYSVMADAWFDGIWRAAANGWIHDPVPSSGDSNHVTCDHNPNWIPKARSPIALVWDRMVVCSTAKRSIQCACTPSDPSGLSGVQVKPSGGSCSDLNDNSTSVRFANLNGDGGAEHLWLNSHGVVTAFLNGGGSDDGPNAAKVGWFPQGVITSGVGATRAQVHLADLNGDGRAEYLWVHDDGSVDAWLNGVGGPDDGPNAAKVGWIPQGTIVGGIGNDGKGVRFADLIGDGRSEYLYLEEDGAMTAYLNLGGPDDDANGAKVAWLPQGIVATGPANGATRDNIILADINGDGGADYMTLSTVDKDTGAVQAWLNGGRPDEGPNAAKI